MLGAACGCVSYSLWPFPALSICKSLPLCCVNRCISEISIPPDPEIYSSRKENMEKSFNCTFVPIKHLLLLSLCGTFPSTKISFLHLLCFLTVLFCYKTPKRPSYRIKLPVYCFIFFCLLLFLNSCPGKKQTILNLVIWGKFNERMNYKDVNVGQGSEKSAKKCGSHGSIALLRVTAGQKDQRPEE